MSPFRHLRSVLKNSANCRSTQCACFRTGQLAITLVTRATNVRRVVDLLEHLQLLRPGEPR
jgi:hypothetical protein